MDIYRFLKASEDVKAHCRKIGKTWNTYEMALIIGHSNQPRDERLGAWRELIDIHPDMPDPKNQFDSVHHELTKMIELEERELAVFKAYEPGAYYKTSQSEDRFERFEDAFDAVRQFYHDEGETLDLQKIYTQPDNGSLNIRVQIRQDGIVESLEFACGKLEDYIRIFPDYTESQHYIYARFYQNYVIIDIPNPFKRGDILGSSHNKNNFFLIDSPINGKSHVMSFGGASGEQSSGWGYFVNENGGLYGDHTDGYECYDYYRGILKGKDRLIYHVGRYFKGEINIDELLYIQCQIMLESLLKNNFGSGNLRNRTQLIDLSAEHPMPSKEMAQPVPVNYTETPIPFERGDILTGDDGGIFVFAGVGADDAKIHAYEDNDDMEVSRKALADYDNTTYGWGYFVNENGLLYGDHLLSKNANYTHYQGKLEGNHRLLHYLSLYFKGEIGIAAMLNMQCRIFLECKLSNNFNIDSHGCYVPVELLAENRLTQDEKEELERTDGVMPWVAGKLTIHQVDYLVREYGGDREKVQLELKDYGGWCLGMCAGIAHDENHYEKTGDDKFNPARREMARMILAAYGHTETGWIDEHANPGTGAEINGVHIPMPDYSKLPTEDEEIRGADDKL